MKYLKINVIAGVSDKITKIPQALRDLALYIEAHGVNISQDHYIDNDEQRPTKEQRIIGDIYFGAVLDVGQPEEIIESVQLVDAVNITIDDDEDIHESYSSDNLQSE